jgi:hypothetical protein
VEYEVPAFQAKDEVARKCTFTDSGDPGALDQNDFYSKRLKWHEEAPSKMNVWDLNNLGMRHTCFVTNLDLSFEVETNENPSQEEMVKKMITHTEPFSFIVETVYLFLDLHIYEPSVRGNIKDKNKQTVEVQLGKNYVLDIGILKFTGKTGEIIKAQKFHHKKYIRDYLEEKQMKVGSSSEIIKTLMLLLHHIPFDNKKFVFVVDDQKVFKTFKEFGEKMINLMKTELTRLQVASFKEENDGNGIQELIAKTEIEFGFFKNIINRLEKNEKARKQQVEVLYMQPYRKDEGIRWDNNVGGKIPSETTNPNSFYALLSRDLTEYDFNKLTEKQFNVYLELQMLWNFTYESEEQRAATVCRLNKLPKPFEENTIYLDLVFDMKAPISVQVYKKDEKEYNAKKKERKDFYMEIEKYEDSYRQEIESLYKRLDQYSKKPNKNGHIKLRDFQDMFRPEREIDNACPNDPATGKFPYRKESGSTGINRWHRAWHMSYAFFKEKEMPVDWTVPVDPVPENSSPAQNQVVDLQPRDPVPSRPQEQPPSVPQPAVNPSQSPEIIDLTDSPPTSPTSHPQQERNPKKPRLNVKDETHQKPSSSSSTSQNQTQDTDMPPDDEDEMESVDEQDEMESDDEPTTSRQQDVMEQEEEDEAGVSPNKSKVNVHEWLDAQVAQHNEEQRKAEEKRKADAEKMKSFLKDFPAIHFTDAQEPQWERPHTTHTTRLYIAALLQRLKIYSTE